MIKKISFIGAGSMAEAIFSGLIHKKIVTPQQITAMNRSNKKRRDLLQKMYNIHVTNKLEEAVCEADLIFLAVKPKDAEKVLNQLKGKINNKTVILSVLAGISTRYIEELVGDEVKVVRVMPNTSSAIGESATAISAGSYCNADELTLAKTLLSSIGEVTVISEKQMDVFTGIAGSGPAYIYFVIEQLEQAGVNEGMDRELARKIAAQTVLGAGKMIQETDHSPADLRKKVTSPNGTTAAGLAALEKNGGGKAFLEAVKHASQRSKEISHEYQNKLLPV